MKNQQDKPVAIRISVVTDNRSISHSEWLQYNDKFKDLGIVFEISDNGYPSMAMSLTNFTNLDIISWVKIGEGSIEDRIYNRLSICRDWQMFLSLSVPFSSMSSMDNVIDLYMTPQSEYYYLDSECSNAAVLVFTDPCFPLVEVRDRIIKSFKVNVYCDGSMMLIDCGRESHDVAMGRMRRIAALCFIQMEIPADHYMINDKFISYVDDNKSLNAIYIY